MIFYFYWISLRIHISDQFIFLKFIICSNTYLIIAFGLPRFFTLSDTPKISPASLTKYSTSLFAHLLVNWANLTFYWENSSSKSNNYRGGLGNYLRTGGNTPGANPSSGTSNWGTIKDNCSCLTSILLNKFTVSGTRSKSYLNNWVSNMLVKSLGSYSPY